jgi:hypothetical protein
MTALVSFDRVFEVFDLKPMITQRPGALPLAGNGSGAKPAPARGQLRPGVVPVGPSGAGVLSIQVMFFVSVSSP